MMQGRHARTNAEGRHVRSSRAEARAMLSRAPEHDTFVVERVIDRATDQVFAIFGQGLGDWGDVAGWVGVGDDATAGRVHGLVRYGAPWTETDGSLCRHYRLCPNPTTAVDWVQCLRYPRLSGRVRLVTMDVGTQLVTLTCRPQEPTTRIGRVLADGSACASTARTWADRLADAISTQLERGAAPARSDTGRGDIFRLPLPAAGAGARAV